MTYTDGMGPPSTATATHGSPWEPCDHCQAPLAEHQRYCVVCGARRAQADDPVARYFVTAARRARASEAAPEEASAAAARSAASNLRAAIVLALLPVAAAAGVMVGRDSGGSNQQLVDALRAQKAPVVNVVGGGAGTTDTSGSGSGSDGGKVVDKNPNDANGTVIAHGAYGTARQLTGAKPNAAQLEESKKALQHIVDSKGKEYVEQQRNLPDQIIIP